MPILAGFAIFIQCCFAFHVVKSGRPYWWILIIMAIPLLGCLLYYFIEVFPETPAYLDADRAERITEARDAGLQRRAAELEAFDSVENRLALAAECSKLQMHAEAERLCETCLTGAFQTDAAVLFSYACAAVDNCNWSKASEVIDRLRVAAPNMRPHEVKLLDARILEGQGDNDAAISVYRGLVADYAGLEARYRYASFLSRLNQHESAIHGFNEILKHSRRFATSNEKEQRWVDAARQAVVNIGAER